LAVAALAALVIAITTSRHAVRAVYASTGCTDATLTGNYALSISGFTTQRAPSGSEVPFAIVGVETFDGAGSTSASYTLVVNGKLSDAQTTSGTYTVNSDCTGSISFVAGDAAGVTENLAIIGSGTELFGIVTSPSNTLTFDAKKQ
jgi:hypothetical protein